MPIPLSVTHAVLSLDCGGLERIVVDLVRDGRKRGHNVNVVCLERPGTLAAQVGDVGGRLICLRKSPGLSWKSASAAIAALRELRPDVLHTHQIAALHYTGSASRCAQIPVVVHTEHGNHVKGKSWARRVRQRALWGLAGRYAARFFCVSDEIAREVRRFHVVAGRKVRVVCNGIDISSYEGGSEAALARVALGFRPNDQIIGTVGRLNEVKRQDLLIRAFGRIRVRFPQSHLLLVGDGPNRSELEALVRTCGLVGAVHFAGYQARPEQFYQAMNVFVLTSRSEGMPLSVLEAWAAGRPVVASAVGGLPLLINHGRTGLLVPFGDEDALVRALEAVLADAGYARELGRAAKEHVREHYSLERMAEDYETHYRELLNRSVARPLRKRPIPGSMSHA